jgi:hypothetical protein
MLEWRREGPQRSKISHLLNKDTKTKSLLCAPLRTRSCVCTFVHFVREVFLFFLLVPFLVQVPGTVTTGRVLCRVGICTTVTGSTHYGSFNSCKYTYRRKNYSLEGAEKISSVVQKLLT